MCTGLSASRQTVTMRLNDVKFDVGLPTDIVISVIKSNPEAKYFIPKTI